jgi:parallel beta-helix repeat protein
MSGSYTSTSCIVTNIAPTVTTTSPVTSITQASAIGGGNVTSNGGSTVTVSGLVWSTSLNPTTLDSKTTDGWALGGPWTSTMTGLTCGNDYYVRAYATNSIGTSYGSNVSFTTGACNTIPTVTTPTNTSVTSNLNTASWTRDDWRNRCNNGIHTRAKLNSNYIIENNVIKNTAFSLAISSSNTIVRGNTIQYFTNDANRILGSDILYENNKTADIIKVMTVLENHDDLFQGFTTKSGGEGVDTLKNVIVRKNIFITCTDTTRTFRGTTQGLGMFDGPFYNWTVENNIVLVDHWHGISFYGGINCKIINNTVLDPYPYTPYNSYDNNSTTTGPAWIFIGQKSTTIPSVNNIVRNNLVHNTVSIGSVSMGTASNNIIVGTINNFKNYFVDATDLSNPEKFDLHLKPGCNAIDAGDATYAPATDFDGISRPQGLKCDIGAYEYVVPNAISEIDGSIKQISISPNPFTNEISIQSTNGFIKGDKIQVYTIGGQLVYSNTLTNTTQKIQLNNLSDFPTGLLLLKIEDLSGLKYASKLIKKD